MAKIFRIYASQGKNRYVELDLPASDYEMLDLMDQLRLGPGQHPHMELLNCSETFDYLCKQFPDQTDIYQLNVLARQLDKLDTRGTAAFEGLVGMELQRKRGEIPLPRLIDFAYNTDCCHVVADVMTDVHLGKFLVEKGFIEEANGLPDSMIALLDFGRIGMEHRKAEGGVFTSCGYVEQHSELQCVSERMDFQPKKPAYTVLLNMAVRPLQIGAQPEMIQVRLPMPEQQMQEAMEQLGARNWGDIVASIVDCPTPRLNHQLYMFGEMPQIIELADRLSELDGRGQMAKYKALLAANNCNDLSQMIALADTVDEYIFEPQISRPEDVAREELEVVICSPDTEMLLPHIDLTGYGRDLLERDHARITRYGLLEPKPPEQIQDMEQRGMVMI